MMTQVFIQPKDIVYQADFILVEAMLKLNSGAMITYTLNRSPDGLTLKTDSFDLTQEEYDNWGTDDNYIIDLVCQREGLVRKN